MHVLQNAETMNDMCDLKIFDPKSCSFHLSHFDTVKKKQKVQTKIGNFEQQRCVIKGYQVIFIGTKALFVF